MSQSLVKVVLHIVFSTKYREKSIHREIRGELYQYIAGTAQELGCIIYKIGGVEDHIHIASSLSKTLTISSLLETIKSNSSKWIKTRSVLCRNFAWQNGYAAFSIGYSHIDTLKTYIENQAEHHHKKTFKEELIEHFKLNDVEYDERYIWD